MQQSTKTMTVVVFALLVSATGCSDRHRFKTATDRHMDRMEEVRTAPPTTWMQMADNALLQDMSIADFHFAGHTAELSGTGAARLSRMSPLLSTYGGTVRYDTELTDEKLIEQRLNHVKEFLVATGCDMSRVEIKTGMSAGTGLTARKAIEVDIKGTAKPQRGGGAPQVMSVPANAPRSGN